MQNETSWEAATREGLSYFWVHMHTGNTVAFVGQSWEDGGFYLNDSDEPARDSSGNTVAKFTVEDLDQNNASHVAQVEEWFGN